MVAERSVKNRIALAVAVGGQYAFLRTGIRFGGKISKFVGLNEDKKGLGNVPWKSTKTSGKYFPESKCNKGIARILFFPCRILLSKHMGCCETFEPVDKCFF